jgi:isoleucyl-tRNA synthetase
MVRLAAPIMTFTSDEVWQLLPATGSREESVHLALFPEARDVFGVEADHQALQKLTSEWTSLMSVRDEALKALETARQEKLIGSSLEASVTMRASAPLYELLQAHTVQLRALLIISEIKVEEAASGNGNAAVHVSVSRAPGIKCERCWNYSTHVGEDARYPTVCERCIAALKELALS